MIPSQILEYLDQNGIPYTRHAHPRAVSAQELAASVHFTGYRVAKSVIVEADGTRYIAVLPAAEMLDEAMFASVVNADAAWLVNESEFDTLFPNCETGAEPPFGGLYGLPVILDQSLATAGPLLVRAGSHEETLELDAEDFIRLERPRIATIGSFRPPMRQPTVEPEMRV